MADPQRLLHPGPVADLDDLPFDNRYTRSLPGDDGPARQRRQVHGAAWSAADPAPTRSPSTVAVWPEVADLLGLGPDVCRSADFAAVFSGNRVPRGAEPFAMTYGGHQFGNWAGQLGDGRAIGLGEMIDTTGRHQTLQLKGAGPTPYSRTADGRAVLRSSLREFVCSEAMFHLGIPTTRALSLVLTGDDVVRDMLYDGHPAPEPGAVVCRVAPSFVRFGSFELPAARGDIGLLRALVDHTIATGYPHLAPGDVAGLFAEVADRTIDLVVAWMRVGFVHGVLNTDNMSILGLTIDYGPYGWLEGFDPGWTPNTTDAGTRRYRYGAQPQVVQWNLLQLANALAPLVDDVEPLQAVLDAYSPTYHERFSRMTAERLGWGRPQAGDGDLVASLFELLQRTETDQVIFFRQLAQVPVAPVGGDETGADEMLAPLLAAFYRPEDLDGDVGQATVQWLREWGHRVRAGGLGDRERMAQMDSLNPRFVFRNWLAQEAIDACVAGDHQPLHDLMDVLRQPYDNQPGRDHHAARRPEWARTRVGCSMLSCSS